MHQAPRRHAFAARHPWLGPSGCSSLPQRRNSSRICQSSTGIPAETSNFPAEISHFPAEFQRNEVTIMPTYPSGQTRQCAEFEAALQCSALWRCHAASAPITFYLFLSTFMTAEGCNGPASMASLRFHTPPYPTRLRAARLSAGRLFAKGIKPFIPLQSRGLAPSPRLGRASVLTFNYAAIKN